MKHEYGFSIQVLDLEFYNERVMGTRRRELDERILRAFAYGNAIGKHSDDVDWILGHQTLKISIDRDLSARATNVHFVVVSDDTVETPPSKRYKLEEGIATGILN